MSVEFIFVLLSYHVKVYILLPDSGTASIIDQAAIWKTRFIYLSEVFSVSEQKVIRASSSRLSRPKSVTWRESHEEKQIVEDETGSEEKAEELWDTETEVKVWLLQANF